MLRKELIVNKTIPGTNREGIYGLIMAAVYQKKGIDKDSMTDEEYDAFVKSTKPTIKTNQPLMRVEKKIEV